MVAQILNFLRKMPKTVLEIFLNHIQGLTSLRIILNWIYALFYIYIVYYAIKHYPDSVNTAITITGGIVSVIFTNYVISKHIKGNNNGKE